MNYRICELESFSVIGQEIELTDISKNIEALERQVSNWEFNEVLYENCEIGFR